MNANPPVDASTPRRTLSRWSLLLRAVLYSFALVAVVYFSTGGLDWPMGWAYIGANTLMLLWTAWGAPIEEDLAKERTVVKADAQAWDRPLAFLLGFGQMVILPLAGLDYRYGWSPAFFAGIEIAGLVLVVLGTALSLWAMTSNRFFSRVVRIQTDRGHTVVTGGPYRFVRHPGYVGGTLAILGGPLALGSLWALLVSVFLSALLCYRTAREDRLLREQLPGYTEYAARTRYQLIPGIY